MANSIRTPRTGTNETSRRIAEAVDDEEWQKFRVSMKGKTTAEKLQMLGQYYRDEQYKVDGMSEGVEKDKAFLDINIRLDNYIKALSRGGQLHAGESLASALKLNWRLRIKK